MKRRRLGDLFVRGKEVSINDGEGDPVVVWIAKLNEIDRESVVRRAQAAKARYMIDADDEESDVFASMYATVRDYDDRETIVRIAIGPDVRRFRLRVESEVGADPETWGKDNYLQGLFDAWVGTDDEPGLAQAAAEDPDDPEAKKVRDELNRYEQQVGDRLKAEVDRLHADWDDVPDEQLWRKAAHVLLERRADEIFIREAERQQVFHSTRTIEDHRKRYFGSVGEVDDLDEKVRTQLTNAFNALMVDALEGKDSPATRDSSPSSESPAKEEPEESGLQALSA